MKEESLQGLAQDLRAQIDGKVQDKVSVKNYCSFKIGGLVDLMVFPSNESDVIAATAWCMNQGVPFRVIGWGTNLLFPDGTLHEVIINLKSLPGEMERKSKTKIVAGAGARLAHVVKFSQEEGLAGLEFGAGIPGSIGGAIHMNAGAHGRTMGELVFSARGFKPGQPVRTWTADKMNFIYRELKSPKGIIWLEAVLEMDEDDPRAVRERIVRYLKTRRSNQPLEMPSAGSVFKNPPGDFAGRLIDELGLRGERIGDAQISEKHANFIVNRGHAKYEDVLALIDLAKEKVRLEFGVELELEIEIIGRD